MLRLRSAIWSLLSKLNLTLISLLLAAVALGFAVGAFELRIDSEGETIPLKIWESDSATEPASRNDILKKLDSASAVAHLDTHLSTRPFWFSFNLSTTQEGPWVAYLPSRDAISMACWAMPAGASIGSGDRSSALGKVVQSRSGFAIEMPTAGAEQVMCRALFRGPARVSLEKWPQKAFAKSELAHQSTGAAIEAGIGILALFMLLTAAVNQSTLYLMFAGWLLLSMRMAAISFGSDFHFFGNPVDAAYLTPLRQWTVSLYYATAVSLFCQLFEDNLRKIKAGWPLAVFQLSALAILLVCAVSSFETTLQAVWLCTGFSVCLMLFYLVRILRRTQSRAAFWYGMAVLMTVAANLNEVVAASMGHHGFIFGLNSVTAAIGSALLTCLAVAEHLRSDRLQRVAAQKALEKTYLDSPIGLFTVMDGQHIVHSNPAFQRMVQGAEVARRNLLLELFGPTVLKEINTLRGPDKANTVTYLETRLATVGATGELEQWFAIQASTPDGLVVEASLQDITEKVQATRKLNFLADHDVLTKCLNWRGLASRFHSPSPPLALAYLDLDRFKLINDLYGHAAGDNVLCLVSKRIQSVLGAGDLIARIGGDEFLIAFRSTGIQGAEVACRRIVDLISSNPFAIESRRFVLGVSCGLVETASFGQVDMKEMVSAADSACRMAKKRAPVHLVTIDKNSSFFDDHKDELELIEQLEQGITPEGLFLVMQPEISLTDPGASLNFEVLLRLRKSNGGILSAGVIIEAAEAHGRSALIDRWVVTETIAWLEQHGHKLVKTQFVGVNLSGGSLNDQIFVEELFCLFEQHKTALSMIFLEITETVALTDMGNMQRFIARARAMGARVGLDDFGAGYSSFGYLKHLSVDAIKLDGSMVRDAPTNASGMAIVMAVGGLIKGLGLKSIGEFAESLEIIKILVAAGIDYAQGYAICKPVLPERILEADSALDLIQDIKVLDFFMNLAEETEILRELILGYESLDSVVSRKLLS